MKFVTKPGLLIQLKRLENFTTPRVRFVPRQMEFHISRDARIKYQFNEALFSLHGNVVIPNFRSAREFAQKMNGKRDVINFPEKAVRAGQINAMGLIDEILHYVVEIYREQEKAQVTGEILEWLESNIGREELDRTLETFLQEFPPLKVYRGETNEKEYLSNESGGVANRDIVAEELLLLWLANLNPAFSPFIELFDDEKLEKGTAYKKFGKLIHEFFDDQPKFGPENQNLIDMLRAPAIAEPHSLKGQLEYIRKNWGLLLGKYFYRLLGSLDFLKEEEKAGGLGPGPAEIYEFKGAAYEEEPERFSPDKDWMPRTVLLAKSTYVWLDQLSKKYQRQISRLDQIPDEELDTLSRWGFTGVWLIGLWERSRASQNIKRMCGNPEAVASAYSLFDYQIAEDLGGEEAYRNLKDRAWQRGIRMCGDMVPNHMGIDSKWVIQNPERFLSLDYSPYPSYSFNGQNLSWDNRVGLYIEDHYYDRSDAAVVFKRVDFETGDTKYIYHGNDGTSMPWNDTAQLNYLNHEVREAVIQTILDVARRFPIIRFDAAMTLAKKHYQRLWFPEPGSGGDIPSRADHAITRDEFNRLFPEEFWREVVDRVAREVPDTLLLAEAFWLMEGYFVRTLGMHRVYNSAFMNMLKNEENAKYRASIKNVIDFNPEILKRFVNFMNNPDEDTAIAQFGRDDKYFGVCMMMVTMPGLPMFGHGQIEGFTEKYGMEYRKAYWDEHPDPHLISRHEQEIFPLMRKRYLFAEVNNFEMYDFFAPEGYVNENVFAYSNRFNDERALVIYNNKFEDTRGWIRMSSARLRGDDDGKNLQQKNLGEGLDLSYKDNHFVIFRDQISGLEFIRRSRSFFDNGLYVELGAFKYQVFLNFREVEDNVWNHYANLEAYLDGRGVPDIDQALKETFLQPIHKPFKGVSNVDMFRKIKSNCVIDIKQKPDEKILDEVEGRIASVLSEIKKFTSGEADEQKYAELLRREMEIVLTLPVNHKLMKCSRAKQFRENLVSVQEYLENNGNAWNVILGWWTVHYLGAMQDEVNYAEESLNGIDEWLLGKILQETFRNAGADDNESYRSYLLIKVLTQHQEWWKPKNEYEITPGKLLKQLLKDTDTRNWLQINRYQEVLYYNGEAFDELMTALLIISLIKDSAAKKSDASERCTRFNQRVKILAPIISAAADSRYQVERLLEGVKK